MNLKLLEPEETDINKDNKENIEKYINYNKINQDKINVYLLVNDNNLFYNTLLAGISILTLGAVCIFKN